MICPKHFAVAVIACLALLTSAGAQQSDIAFDAHGESQWMSDYYVNNDLAHIPEFLSWLQSDDALASNKSAEYPVSAFLAAVFSANPSRVRSWVGSTRFTGNAKDCIERALWLAHQGDLVSEVLLDRPDYLPQKPPSMMSLPLNNPSAFDMMWGAFFATGDTRYAARLIDVLDPSISLGNNKVMDAVLRQTAAWSLASNMRNHERILGLLREESTTRKGIVRDVLMKMLADYDAENKPWPDQTGEFRAMLLLLSEDSLKAFGAPSDKGVSVTPLSSAKPGDHIAVKLAFAGMDLSKDLSASVSYDFKILAPDGSLYGGVNKTGLTALSGRVPTRFRVFDNNATPIVVFDAQAPLGKYTFIAVIRDNNGHHALSLSQQITLTR